MNEKHPKDNVVSLPAPRGPRAAYSPQATDHVFEAFRRVQVARNRRSLLRALVLQMAAMENLGAESVVERARKIVRQLTEAELES